MKTRLLVLFIIGTIGFSFPFVFACQCVESTLEQRIENADVIFSGKLYPHVWDFSKLKIAGNFNVIQVWKGSDSFPQITTGDVTVVTGVDSGMCGVQFIPNNEYLIFAKIDGDVLTTNTCSGSWFLDGRAEYVKELDAIGSTHHFIDAREIKRSSSDDCRGPGPYTVEQCEFDKLVRNVFLPVGIALPIVVITVFFLWRKRK
ncbi:MAG: cobalamin biosynthesis protein CbiN [Nitrosopumilus sp.]|nr:cobalamin biosynthesis protein CbiN [Nitrosopumilus sp.]